jgi:hypothetical protein
MRIPLNVTAEIVAKLEAEILSLQGQIEFANTQLATSQAGVEELSPFAEWGEEPTPAA